MISVRDIPFGRPWITDADRQAVMAVLDGHILTHGPQCKAFEEEFGAALGEGAHCVSVSSCTAALHLAYIGLGIGPGDEVIVPAQTHAATAHAVEWVGARPIFVDCEAGTGNLTAAAIEQALTPRTRAICVVHFVGIPCDMPAIMAVARRRELKVVEDCAIAIGARYDGVHVGLFGDAGCFSFYPVKHITTAEGGMFVSRDPALAASVATTRALGVDRTHQQRSVPGLYDVVSLGLNYRMSELQAALGRTQIARLDQSLAVRNRNFEALRRSLADVPGISCLDASDPKASNSHYCCTLQLDDTLRHRRNDAIAALNQRGVGTSIHYPQPVPRMSYYQGKYGYAASDYPRAERISDGSIALPVAVHVSEEDCSYMAEAVKEVMREISR